MLKWILLALCIIAAALYFTGTLDFDASGDKIDISIDKDKAKELGESIKDKIED